MFRCENLSRARTRFFGSPSTDVILQLDLKRENYLHTYSWLRIEEGDKWYCWFCHWHQYNGARDKLGTTKARPSRQEKLTEHAKNPSHIEVTKLHAAKLKKGQEADASTALFEKEDPRDVVTFTAAINDALQGDST